MIKKTFKKYYPLGALILSAALSVAMPALATTVGTNVSVTGTLTVSGTGTSTIAGPWTGATGDLIVARGGTGNLLLNPYGGNVGIGTTSPAQLFSAAGNGYFTGGLGVGLANTTAGTLQTSGNGTIGGTLSVSGTATSTFAGGISLSAGNLNLPTGGAYLINNANILNATTLGSSVVTSSLTSVGALSSGSIASGFGTINIGSNSLTAGTTTVTNLAVTNISTSTFSGGLAVETNALVVDNTSNKVGVGTTTPVQTLSIVGNTYLTGGLGVGVSNPTAGTLQTSGNGTIGGLLTVSGAGTSTFSGGLSANLLNITSTTASSTFSNGIILTGGCLQLPGGSCLTTGAPGSTNGAVQFNSAGSLGGDATNFFWDNTNKRLGIGTSTPNNPLQAVSTTLPQLVLTDMGGGTNLKHVYASSTAGAWSFGTLNDALTAYTERMRITNAGNVGIGTTSPATNLSVLGNIYGTGGLGSGVFESTAGNITGSGRLSITSTTATSTFSTGGLTVGTNQLVVQQTSGKVGVLTTNPNTAFEVVGVASTTNLVVGGGTTILNHYSATASLTFPSIASSSCQVLTIAVTNAADGDVVTIGMPNAIASASTTLAWSGWVSAAGTVSVRLCQVATSGTSPFSAATVRADVWKH